MINQRASYAQESRYQHSHLDHLAQGRFMFGVGASGLPTDWAMFNVDGMNGQRREMTRESLEIILKILDDTGPYEYKGKFWDVEKPDTMFGTLKFWLKPYQRVSEGDNYLRSIWR